MRAVLCHKGFGTPSTETRRADATCGAHVGGGTTAGATGMVSGSKNSGDDAARAEDPAPPVGSGARSPLGRIPPEVRTGAVIIGIAVLMASAFAAAYIVALGRPIPRHIPLGVVGPASVTVPITNAMQTSRHELNLRTYPSRQAAIDAVDRQTIAAVLDGTAAPPQLLISSASDPSTARALTQMDQPTPGRYLVPIVDLHPLPPSDPQGLATFYVVIAATILGFVTTFQLRANVKTLTLGSWLVCLAALAILGGAALALVAGPILNALQTSFAELWLLISVHVAIAALFNSTMLVLMPRWAIIPTWGVFILLGNTSSGGAVSAPLLPQPFAFLHSALPTGAAVSAIQAATYFPHHQPRLPFVVLGAWLCVTLAALVVSSRATHRSPAE
ncbi:MAG: rane protein [Mycobacterium sp.]|jgi:hypothetical protein|nr:rane protein [Mycobacterium sp.]